MCFFSPLHITLYTDKTHEQICNVHVPLLFEYQVFALTAFKKAYFCRTTDNRKVLKSTATVFEHIFSMMISKKV